MDKNKAHFIQWLVDERNYSELTAELYAGHVQSLLRQGTSLADAASVDKALLALNPAEKQPYITAWYRFCEFHAVPVAVQNRGRKTIQSNEHEVVDEHTVRFWVERASGKKRAKKERIAVLVDAVDWPEVAEHRWNLGASSDRKSKKERHYVQSRISRYARSPFAGEVVRLHLFLLGPQPRSRIRFLDGDLYNCRRENLLVVPMKKKDPLRSKQEQSESTKVLLEKLPELSQETVRKRLKRGWSREKALLTPPMGIGRPKTFLQEGDL